MIFKEKRIILLKVYIKYKVSKKQIIQYAPFSIFLFIKLIYNFLKKNIFYSF
ncbi:hypothetical protein CCYN2B_80013 [Capnocytophaga cynodegmi]|uniref:Uncharacterized protein n=1 Tax=Capnocytophaga cynodegmi TaxID=28189 RepID=A0A0B7HKH7_9FLAO|nr:hypothetical protein CCYN2B_80013 [Capnocytophaga cynodegmi]